MPNGHADKEQKLKGLNRGHKDHPLDDHILSVQDKVLAAHSLRDKFTVSIGAIVDRAESTIGQPAEVQRAELKAMRDNLSAFLTLHGI